MGQAIDLPDPTQAPPAAAGPASADDLLSQLAGDEIDRLLAESDAEEAEQVEAEAQAKAGAEAKAKADAEAQAAIPAVAPASPTTASPAPSEPQPAPVDDDATLASELDQIIQAGASGAAATTLPQETPVTDAKSQATPADAMAVSTAPGSTEAAVAPMEAKALDASLAAQATTATTELKSAVSEIETSLQERSALADGEADLSQEPAEDETPIPLYLKPLVWLNAPIMLLPEPLRDAVGKVALLTFFNACAILTYVMMFRRHHH